MIMKSIGYFSTRPPILSVVDRDKQWLQFCSRELYAAHYKTIDLQDYTHARQRLHKEQIGRAEQSQLVILGCARANEAEFDLLSFYVDHGYKVLVLCTTLSYQDTLALFRNQATNVYLKPYTRETLIEVVHETLELISKRTSRSPTN